MCRAVAYTTCTMWTMLTSRCPVLACGNLSTEGMQRLCQAGLHSHGSPGRTAVQLRLPRVKEVSFGVRASSLASYHRHQDNRHQAGVLSCNVVELLHVELAGPRAFTGSHCLQLLHCRGPLKVLTCWRDINPKERPLHAGLDLPGLATGLLWPSCRGWGQCSCCMGLHGHHTAATKVLPAEAEAACPSALPSRCCL